ncbi:MAG TPA: DUF1844 domain-containing protein [Candidatus Deferrimicrobiaceae bacterium]
MAEEREDKGFKVVDKRSMSDEERDAERKPAETIVPGPEAAKPHPPEGDAPGGPEAVPPGAAGHPEAGAHPHGLHPPGFLDLVQSLQYSAMLHLGMVQGPDGHRSPVDLPAAQDAIDMMGVLKEKTKGNLTADEDGMLTEGLYVLRMSYLAAMNAGKKP